MAPFKAGFVAILGQPNVGKSTLLNALLKFKLSIVSPEPQTTRHKILGILNGEDFQICFLDTPGFIETPKDALQQSLKRTARAAARDEADVALLVVEPGRPPEEDLTGLRYLGLKSDSLILAVNKIDAANPERIETAFKSFREALKPSAELGISALKGTGVPALMKEILARLPESPAFYDKDQSSDRWERFFAAEIVREQVFALYGQEIPHSTAVVIEDFKEGQGRPDQVHATLYVERDGQKGIIVGKDGRALRALTKNSREALEAFLGRPAELDIWIKVRKNWRKDPRSLAEFGY